MAVQAKKRIRELMMLEIGGSRIQELSTYTAITKNEGEWWIGWIEEIPGVSGEVKTKEELLASLREI